MRLDSPVKGIFFDVGWTLIRPASVDWFINKTMIEFVGINTFEAIRQTKMRAAVDRAFKYLEDNHLMFTEDDELKQFEVYYSMLADDLPELALTKEQISIIAYSRVFDMSNYLYLDSALTTLDALKGKYKLGIISDTWPSIERIFRNAGIENYFDAKTYSYLLGIFKPNKRIYLHAIEQMKLPPGQTIFVDDVEKNLDGAVECGIQPVLITAKPNTENSGKYPSIKKLSDLIKILPD